MPRSERTALVPVSSRETFGARRLETPDVSALQTPQQANRKRSSSAPSKDISAQLKNRLSRHIPKDKLNKHRSNRAGSQTSSLQSSANDSGYTHSFTQLVEAGLAPTNDADLTASIAELLGEQHQEASEQTVGQTTETPVTEYIEPVEQAMPKAVLNQEPTLDLGSTEHEKPQSTSLRAIQVPTIEPVPDAPMSANAKDKLMPASASAESAQGASLHTVVDIALDGKAPIGEERSAEQHLNESIVDIDLQATETADDTRAQMPARYVDAAQRAVELTAAGTSNKTSKVCRNEVDEGAPEASSVAVQNKQEQAVVVASNVGEPSTLAATIDVEDDMLSAYSNLPPNAASQPTTGVYRLWRTLLNMAKKVISLPKTLFRRVKS